MSTSQYPARQEISPAYWGGLRPCRECAAPLLDQYPPKRAQGNYWHPDIPLSPYEAVNLLEALKVVKDTGDWHGQLRFRCEQVLAVYGHGDDRPNAPAEDMRA